MSTHSRTNELLTFLWEFGEPGNLNFALEKIAETALHRFSADACVIAAINPITGKFLDKLTIVGVANKNWPGPRDDGFTRRFMQSPEGAFIEGLEVQPEYQNAFTKAEGFRSYAAVPLLTQRQRKPLALLYLDYKDRHEFSEEERSKIFAFAKEAALVLENVWFLRRYREVARIGQDINQDLETVEILFHKLYKHLSGILDVSIFLLLAEYKPQSGLFDLYMYEEGKYTWLKDQPNEGGRKWVLENKKMIQSPDLLNEDEEFHARLSNIPGTIQNERSLLFLPIIFRGDVPMGALSVQHSDANVYDENDVQILIALTNHLALALSNIRLFTELTELNQTGQLLTKQLDSEQILQSIVDQIRAVTQSDITVLFPYHEEIDKFEFPPYSSGQRLQPDFPQATRTTPDDMAYLVIHREQPVYGKENQSLYELAGGDPKSRTGSFERREKILSSAAMPLRVGNEAVGVLFINFRHPQRFDEPQRQLFQGLANYAAIALKNSRRFGALTQRREFELKLLQDIEGEIGKTLQLSEILQIILEKIVTHVAAEKAAIFLYNEQAETLEKKAVVGSYADRPGTPIIPIAENKGILQHVFMTKIPARVDNVREDPTWKDIYIEVSNDILSEIDVPILDGEDQVIGIINLESTTEAAFTHEDQVFLVTLAGRVGLAIKNSQAYEREKRLREERESLMQIGKQLTKELDVDAIFDAILSHALNLTGASIGGVRLVDRRANELELRAVRHPDDVEVDSSMERLPLDKGITGWVVQNKEPFDLIKDTSDDPRYVSYFQNMRSEIVVSFLYDGEILGVINLESPDVGKFDKHDVSLLQALADYAVIAILNAERFEKATQGQRRLIALHDVDKQIISQQRDPDRVMQQIVVSALDLTEADTADLYLYEEGNLAASYYLKRSQDISLDAVQKDKSPKNIKLGIVSHVVQTGTPYFTFGDAQKDTRYQGDRDVHSEVAVPLILELSGKRELIGVLNLEAHQIYEFDQDDVEILDLLAGQAVIAIQNARFLEDIYKTRHRFEVLAHIGRQLLSAPLDPKAIYDIALNEGIEKLGKARSFSAWLWHEQDQRLDLIASKGSEYDPSKRRPIAIDEGVNGWVARHRRTCPVYDVNSPPDGVTYRKGNSWTRSELVVPMQVDSQYYGNLDISFEQRFGFDDDDISLVEGIADQIASAIHRQQIEVRAVEAEAMANFGQQAYELNHRLGNNLGLVRSYVNNITNALSHAGFSDTLVNDYLGKVVQDVQQVLNMSEKLGQELKSFERGVDRHQKRERVPVHLLIEEARRLVHFPPSIELRIEQAEDLGAVQIELSQVSDILYNLFTNAIDAMKAGGVLTVHGERRGGYVALKITDTGEGISADKLSKIFNLFYSTKPTGTGFGLWSARRNALASGGDLHVHSQRGVGSTFTLLLPQAERDGTL
ncbi:MAG: GAF domain-containing protein [Caldilineaceae bacterium]|nr:GAF domain-containing protein [Caldilineaceae bacterium]